MISLPKAKTEIINKGPMTEMVEGLEMLRNKTSNLPHELYYWIRLVKNSQAEIDYVEAKEGYRKKRPPSDEEGDRRGRFQ